MDSREQSQWLTNHIPHRVRAGVALLDGMEKSLLGAKIIIAPTCQSAEESLYWRIVTNSVFEGRLAATRWLIEFVGINQDRNGVPCNREKSKNHPFDVRIEDLDGGEILKCDTDDGKYLADIWKGCSQASGHATHKSNHPSVADRRIAAALTIIRVHLQKTIYTKAGLNIRDCVFNRSL